MGGFVVGMWTSLELRLLIPGEPSHSETRKKLKSRREKDFEEDKTTPSSPKVGCGTTT